MTDSRPAPVLTLLGKPDCHLCHVMREVVERVLPAYGASLVVRDVRDDPQTRERYAREIPILFLEGEELARHRVSEAALHERLAARLPSGRS